MLEQLASEAPARAGGTPAVVRSKAIPCRHPRAALDERARPPLLPGEGAGDLEVGVVQRLPVPRDLARMGVVEHPDARRESRPAAAQKTTPHVEVLAEIPPEPPNCQGRLALEHHRAPGNRVLGVEYRRGGADR